MLPYTIVYVLLGISPASDCGLPTFRKPLSVPSSKAGCGVCIPHIQPLKMELTEGSETSANHNLTPGRYPKEHIQYSRHGESLKSRLPYTTLSVLFSSGSNVVMILIWNWDRSNTKNKYILLLLLLQSALQPLVGFGLLYDFVPQSSIFTLLSPVSQFHLL